MISRGKVEYRRELIRLLISRVTYNRAEQLFLEGRISEKVYVGYMRLWRWGAFHSSCSRQGRYYNRFGKDSYFRRIDRTNALIRKLMELPVAA